MFITLFDWSSLRTSQARSAIPSCCRLMAIRASIGPLPDPSTGSVVSNTFARYEGQDPSSSKTVQPTSIPKSPSCHLNYPISPVDDTQLAQKADENNNPEPLTHCGGNPDQSTNTPTKPPRHTGRGPLPQEIQTTIARTVKDPVVPTTIPNQPLAARGEGT